MRIRPLISALAVAATAGAALTAAAPQPFLDEAQPRASVAETQLLTTVAEDPPYVIQVPGDLRLEKSSDNPYIDDIEQDLSPISLSTVIAGANRSTTACTPPSTANVVKSFCWNSSDESTTEWVPQGITTSADADQSGSWGGTTSMIVSWHSNAASPKGVRLSFVDWSNPSSPKYRLALLVVPAYENGHATLEPLTGVHAGGLAWYGHHLYVADRDLGLRVFDLEHIWQMEWDSTKSKIGYQGGKYYAYNFRYVVPEVFHYSGSVRPGSGKAAQRFSFVSLDRSTVPDSILVGEYGSDKPGRVTRYSIDYTNRLLKTGSDGLAHATYSIVTDLNQIQGVTSIDDRYYLTIMSGYGDNHRGDLVTWQQGASHSYRDTDSLPAWIEDVSYWPAHDQLWTLTEGVNNRYVFALDEPAL